MKTKLTITQADAMKAIRKGNREAEFEVMGPGFHSKCRTFKSKKTYNRKSKHHVNQEY